MDLRHSKCVPGSVPVWISDIVRMLVWLGQRGVQKQKRPERNWQIMLDIASQFKECSFDSV